MNMNMRDKSAPRTDDFEERVIKIKRVSKKTRGGNAIRFTALAVIGNKKGRVGYGYGRAKDVSTAVSKALTKARKAAIDIKITGSTIPHDVVCKFGAAKLFLKPAPKGSGIIAGGVVRVVLELAGIKDVSSKMFGSNNKVSNVLCTLSALQKLKAQG